MFSGQSHSLTLCIAGAGGFLGSAAVEWFSRYENVKEIRCLDFRPLINKMGLSKVTPFYGDLRDERLCGEFVKGSDIVLHFASRGFPLDYSENPGRLVAENIQATSSLLESMKKFRVSKIIYFSSGGALYKFDPKSLPYTEDSAVELRSPYAIDKLATENLIWYYSKVCQLKAIVLRLSNPYGINLLQRGRQGIIGIAFKKIISDEVLEIWGSLDTVKDFIYIDDVMTALELFVANDFPADTYHLGSNVGTSLKDTLDTLQGVMGKKLNIEVRAGKPEDSPWTVLNTEKLRNLTGWSCKFSIEQGIRQMWTEWNRRTTEKLF